MRAELCCSVSADTFSSGWIVFVYGIQLQSSDLPGQAPLLSPRLVSANTEVTECWRRCPPSFLMGSFRSLGS